MKFKDFTALPRCPGTETNHREHIEESSQELPNASPAGRGTALLCKLTQIPVRTPYGKRLSSSYSNALCHGLTLILQLSLSSTSAVVEALRVTQSTQTMQTCPSRGSASCSGAAPAAGSEESPTWAQRVACKDSGAVLAVNETEAYWS